MPSLEALRASATFEEAQELRKHRFYIFVIALLAVVGFIFHGSAAAHSANSSPARLGIGDLTGSNADRVTQRLLDRTGLDDHSGTTGRTSTTGCTGTSHRVTATSGGTTTGRNNKHKPHNNTGGTTATSGGTTTGRATPAQQAQQQAAAQASHNRLHKHRPRNNSKPRQQRLRHHWAATLPPFANVSRVATTATTPGTATTGRTNSRRARGRAWATPGSRAMPLPPNRIRSQNSSKLNKVGVRGRRARLSSG